METIKYQGKILEIVEFDVTQAGKQMVFERRGEAPEYALLSPKTGKSSLRKKTATK